MEKEVLALGTAAILFALGLAGFLVRRHLISVLMSVEVMLAGANLGLVTLIGGVGARVGALTVLAVAAAEAAVGLALALSRVRRLESLDLEERGDLHG